jgi:hypothetical protein
VGDDAPTDARREWNQNLDVVAHELAKGGGRVMR